MAKIKVKGHPELIDVSQDAAIKIKQFRLDTGLDDSTLIDVGNIVVEKRDIRAIFLEQPSTTGHHAQELDKYYQEKSIWRSLPADAKAEKNNAHFELFYYSFFRASAPEEMKDKVKEAAKKYFADHPLRTVMPYKEYFAILSLSPNASAIAPIKKILEQVEITDELEAQKNSVRDLGAFGTYDPTELR